MPRTGSSKYPVHSSAICKKYCVVWTKHSLNFVNHLKEHPFLFGFEAMGLRPWILVSTCAAQIHSFTLVFTYVVEVPNMPSSCTYKNPGSWGAIAKCRPGLVHQMDTSFRMVYRFLDMPWNGLQNDLVLVTHLMFNSCIFVRIQWQKRGMFDEDLRSGDDTVHQGR